MAARTAVCAHACVHVCQRGRHTLQAEEPGQGFGGGGGGALWGVAWGVGPAAVIARFQDQLSVGRPGPFPVVHRQALVWDEAKTSPVSHFQGPCESSRGRQGCGAVV